MKSIATVVKDKHFASKKAFGSKSGIGQDMVLNMHMSRLVEEDPDFEGKMDTSVRIGLPLGEENAATVAMFLIEKSSVLEQITSSRAFHRYLYLTALLRRADLLAK